MTDAKATTGIATSKKLTDISSPVTGPTVTVNGRVYACPKAPTIVVCVDGSERAYLTQAIKAGLMPWTEKTLASGSNLSARSVLPSFTNPNNLSIVTGRPPAVHGISGNFFYDRDSGEEVMMNDPRFLRAGTIMAGFHKAGARVAVVTAKDKLRKLLGHGLTFDAGDNNSAVCFSAEKCNGTTRAEHGIDDAQSFIGCAVPDVYSADLSEVVFQAGVKLLQTSRPDIMYLSTTDFIQHKYAPGEAAANEFYGMMDSYWAKLDELGAVLLLTADHGMNPMHKADGSPDVVYLQPLLDDIVGAGKARVICPITDPYVVHHGALGGFVTAYLPDGTDIAGTCAKLAAVDGIEWAGSGAEGCQRFELPQDRLGDIIVVSRRNKAIGIAPEQHDLSALREPLRSHGGLSTQEVPMIVNRQVTGLDNSIDLRNFDAFCLALNHVPG